MTERYDLAIIGAGSGGLTICGGAAPLGLKTILFEAADMGGDCLNVGCVPSKSIIAAAHAAHVARSSAPFGVTATPDVDFGRAMAHVHEVIAGIAPHDSQERFEGLGATVVRARARLTGKRTIEAGGETYRAKRIVIATGSRPRIPNIPGLENVPYVTNETVWGLTERPAHLLILGGGNIGCELAQAFRRLGSKVTIVERGRLLGKDDPELVDIVERALAREGIAIHQNSTPAEIRRDGDGIAIDLERGDTITGTHLLVAAGRVRNTDDLGLDAARVKLNGDAIVVDDRLRTANKRIFAVGDCREGPLFTHAAGHDGGIVVRNVVFRMRAKKDYSAMPWATFTDPELANVGLTEAMARDKGLKKIETFTAPMSGNDRAKAERATDGMIKVVLSQGKIVGCSIAGIHAGELIQPWILAIQHGLKATQMTGYIAPYPTLGELNKAGANQIFYDKLFSPMVKRLVKVLSWLP
ncbi:MAG: FAD-dependent oxidoreductase [Pseudomonadota bacterium]